MNTCESLADIKAHGDARLQCRVIGHYKQLDARKKHTKPPVYRGHAWIALDDGTHVYLEPPWTGEAIRSDEERARCDGKRVVVVGIPSARMPSPMQPMAHPTGPVILQVTDVQVV